MAFYMTLQLQYNVLTNLELNILNYKSLIFFYAECNLECL